MNEIWEAKRKKLENTLRTSALDLFEHMGNAQALLVKLDPPGEKLFVIAGDVQGILKIMPNNPIKPTARDGGS